jgi:hypothetical protein
MATAMSFPSGRHFFIEAGVLKLTVAKTSLQDAAKRCWSIPFSSARSAARRYRHSRHDRFGTSRHLAALRNFVGYLERTLTKPHQSSSIYEYAPQIRSKVFNP